MFEIGVPRCVLNVNSGGHAVRPGEYSYRYPRILPASGRYCASRFSKENWTRTLSTLSTEFFTHTEIISTSARPSCYVACQLQGNYPAFTHWPRSAQTSEIPSAPSGLRTYLSGVGSPDVKSYTGTARDDFRLTPRINPLVNFECLT